MSYTNEQLELKAHIEKENEAFTAECKARGATFWTTVVTDLDFWAGMEVTTIAEYEHHQAMSTHWDFFKELNDFRPRFMDYKSMTVEQINAEIDLLHKQAEAEAEYERQLIEAEKAEQQRWKEANAYKPNLAFYEALGAQGIDILVKTASYIHRKAPHVLVLADAKRGDVDHTNVFYAIYDGKQMILWQKIIIYIVVWQKM